jgi:DHA3 family tetracycline resistance protein-like MFS transporter
LLRLNAYRLYLLMGAAAAFFSSMIFTGLTLYYIQIVGMNPLQLVLVGTVLEGTILLFEVPTGVLADTYSRRLSVIIGFALIGACYLIQGSLPIFGIIILAEMVRGLGETFLSGAESAWIADEIGEERVGLAYLRHSQMSGIGALAGIAIGTALATIDLQLPILLGGTLLISLSLFLLVAMPETGFHPSPRPSGEAPWRSMRRTVQEGMGIVRGRPVVWMLVLVAVVFGAFSEGVDRLGEAHFLTTFTFPTSIFSGSILPNGLTLQPIVWIGLIRTVGMLLSIGIAELLIRRWKIHGSRNIGSLLLANSMGLILAVIGFGLAPSFGVALTAYWMIGILRSIQYPVANTWLNQHLPSHVRATVLSMAGQADALGQVAGGPIVGIVALRSLRAALVFAGMILTPALVLYSRGLKLQETVATIPPDPELLDA